MPHQADEPPREQPEFLAALAASRAQTGQTLAQIVAQGPTLVVFLRHAGCTFCRQALADIALRRDYFQQQGVRLVLVHHGTEADSAAFFSQFGLEDVPRISDPQKQLYRAFGLGQGRWGQLLGWRVWQRGMLAALWEGHGFGGSQGDVRQMPGVFLLDGPRIVRAFRHRSPSDRPDYVALARPDLVTTADHAG